MKTHMIRSTLAAMMTSALMTSPVFAKDYVIGLPAYQTAEQATENLKTLLSFTASRDANDKVIFYDAYHNTKIASFTIPAGKAYANNATAKLKYKTNGKALKKLVGFVKQTTSQSGNSTLMDTVKAPQFLQMVAENKQGDEKLDVIISGSPFYFDEGDKAFSMRDGVVPSDGHLKTSRANSVFSATAKHRLQGVRVHMALADNTEFNNDRHRHQVTRFWSLLTTLQGGQFVSFRPLEDVLDRLDNQAAPLSEQYQLEQSNRIEMIRYRDVELVTSLYHAPVSQETLSQANVTHAKQVKVGLTWKNCALCDLDLYVQPNPNAETISFKRTKTAFGVYYKDFRGQGTPATGFETIELNQPVNLENVLISVNFFSGEISQPIDAELRLAVNGHIYAKALSITAQSGNQGKDIASVLESNQSSTHTQLIKPLSLIATQ